MGKHIVSPLFMVNKTSLYTCFICQPYHKPTATFALLFTNKSYLVVPELSIYQRYIIVIIEYRLLQQPFTTFLPNALTIPVKELGSIGQSV